MNLTYWAREVGGWFLVLVGLVTFYNAYELLLAKRVFEAAPLTFVGFIIFRGGIHLLKVAVAAQAAASLPEAVAPTVRRPRPAGRPIGPTPTKAVVPGPRNRPVGANDRR
jgi:hypothetical protein